MNGIVFIFSLSENTKPISHSTMQMYLYIYFISVLAPLGHEWYAPNCEFILYETKTKNM